MRIAILPTQSVRSSRQAFTLVELLVVITILLILTSVTIPLAMTGSESRRIREAARLVSGFISGARNRAIEAGRPVGVALERLPSNTAASMLLSYVEIPQPYSGDFTNSTITIGTNGRITDFPQNDVTWLGLIRQGDLVKLNYQGRTYQLFCGEPYIDSNGNGVHNAGEPFQDFITTPIANTWTASSPTLDANGYFQGTAPDPSDTAILWYLASVENNAFGPVPAAGTYPFQIIRQPVKSSGTPLQLPEGAVVDLQWSGEGAEGLITTSAGAVGIMFSPGGAIDSVINFGGILVRRPTGPVHLLVGSAAKAIAGGETTSTDNVVFNYQDQTNLWVSVGYQTGMVSTTEVASWRDVDADNVRDSGETVVLGTGSTWAADGNNSRSIAQTFQTMGGR